MDDFEKNLESLLAVYRHNGKAPDFSRVVVMAAPRRWPYALAAAAAIALMVTVVLMRRESRPNAWHAVDIVGDAHVPHRTLRLGDVVRTTATSRVRLESNVISIDLGPSTSVRLIESRKNRQRIELAGGSIHARALSPPGVFVVDTPGARAIDLGCEYILTVSERGDGLLRVLSGWVELSRGWPQSIVPAGAAAAMSADGRLSAPWFEDAPLDMQHAVRAFSFGDHDALPTLLKFARKRDALTLINLFNRATTADERLMIYDRLNALVPAPPGITRDSVRNWTIATTERWWMPCLQASGVHPFKKPKKGMLRGL